MSIAIKKVKTAFVDMVVPYLSTRGFRGAFPNYRRYRNGKIDILSLQFSLFDQAFCVVIAKCPVEGVTFSNGERIQGDLITANHCPRRLMLGTQGGDLSHWFKFNPTSVELKHRHKFSYLSVYEDSLLKYKEIVDDIVMLVEHQAEPWWLNSPEWWRDEIPVYNSLFFEIQRLKAKQLY